MAIAKNAGSTKGFHNFGTVANVTIIAALIVLLQKVITITYYSVHPNVCRFCYFDNFSKYLYFIFTLSVCSNNHRLVKRKEAHYFDCGKCHRYIICQHPFGCYRCKECFCLDCANEHQVKDSGKRFFICLISDS